MRSLVAAPAGILLVLTLAACSPGAEPSPTPSASAAAPAPAGTPPDPAPALQVGAVAELASGLQVPWSVVPLPEGGALISERDDARILELESSGDRREVTTVAGVDPGGEGGLLGLALQESVEGSDTRWLYAYYTSGTDNRIVRMPLTGTAGALQLGDQQVILSGLAKANNHDGGRLAFGPDGMLYATVGDAGVKDAAQDPDSLNGKILRMTPDGTVPPGNPFGESLVWSMGHRNPQGLAWAADGTMYAAEFGQDTWDELNRIEPGANYGWPTVEGIADDPRFVDPLQQWSTDVASPSGLTAIGGTLFLAGLGGERLWVIQGAGGESSASAAFEDDYGRLRDAVAAPDGSLWLLTNNTDGRGDPRAGDDRLLRVELTPVPE